MRDVQEKSYPGLEEPREGMSRNSEKEKEMLDGVQTREGTAEEFAEFMSNGGF